MANQRSFTGPEARRLLRRARTGTLATLNREDGIPYASLANVATDSAGAPVIMVSSLAWHTRNLMADARASLLAAELPASGDILTGARVTVMGSFRRDDDPALRRRYLARHPEAAGYAGFGDFAFWRLVPDRVHAVAGFGRIETLNADEVFPPQPEMAALEESALAHMNQDHPDAVRRMAVARGGAAENPWRMVAADSDGADLSDGSRVIRVEFAAAVTTADDLRRALAELAKGGTE
jgi:putative heme iron utilization protein